MTPFTRDHMEDAIADSIGKHTLLDSSDLRILAEAVMADLGLWGLYEALDYVLTAHGEQLHDAFDQAQTALARVRGEQVQS